MMRLMDTSRDLTCRACEGTGEVGQYRSGPRLCSACKGAGVILCVFCHREPAAAVLDDTDVYCCRECAPILRSEVCFRCGEGAPIAMSGPEPCCAECLTASRHTTEPCGPPSGMVVANDDGEDHELVDALLATTALVEAAHEANVPVHEAARLVRRVGR